ncbi:MAG: tRNA uridine-5-carboxymethylaminomethyl(34) synthesis enzyme MnmG [Chitinophagales bacterium]|nr:tRNA uridine-5-carboxymethylaminomethyl(34) synthesis enzyme MnmG [Chitinophagales bacterium]MDW8418634.1 tRNA uridine-5-carboxymethylaminomethyl(34) synthesis enzyme MnmG [Chitinophagales bacterium]
MFPEYDVIVVGAGHAGCEAAAAAANLGSRVLLITMNMQVIGQMSCNPAMGGIAKGQIVREIDALGGYSGIVSDRSMVQFRMLNRSKGPAMWSPRTQNDRMLFASVWRNMLENTKNVDFWQEMVSGLLIRGDKVCGVRTSLGIEIYAKSVVLTNGTFLNGIIHIGEKQFGGGRAGESAAKGITEQLVSLGFESGRMKTGTPPRVDGRSLDYSKMEEQPGDESPGQFSFLKGTSPFSTDNPEYSPDRRQLSCYITYTNKVVHDILRTGFDKSPMFTGRIKGVGPRYCPSIEDKIDRFAERDRHQIFVEPEGWNTIEIYVNGFSTSLPEDVQYKALREIPGFENVRMFRPGYAIEYDYFPPTQLELSLQTKLIKGLFFAGQINGTTGYEEAACQGLIAGINAHRFVQDEEPLILKRSDAYIGVLIDDLINKGTEEPYRMFTSRAEYRILLRQDNADLRLTEIGYRIGLATGSRYEEYLCKKTSVEDIKNFFRTTSVEPDQINGYLNTIGTAPLNQKTKLDKIISRPQVTLSELRTAVGFVDEYLKKYTEEYTTCAEIELKYESYILKEKDLVEKMQKLENIRLDPTFDYHSLKSLSTEARIKLSKIKPASLGQASRISGVSPADISVLLVHMGR